MKKIPTEGYPRKKSRLDLKTKELIRTKQYIARKNEKKEFEMLFYQYFDLFWKDVEPAYEEEPYEPFLCHGAYHQHHMLMLPGQRMAVIQFEHFYVGNQLEDVFYLMRKILEKNDWNDYLFHQIMDWYQNIRPLDTEEQMDLMLRLSYPWKNWKLVNYYMQSPKTMPLKKNMEKMQKIIRQQQNWLMFVQKVVRTP